MREGTGRRDPVETLVAAVLAGLLAVAAMVVYPGGTLLDRTPVAYLPLKNFLSDLGSTITYGGHRNYRGSVLFTLSLAVLVVAFSRFLVRLLRTFEDHGTRSWARAAVIAGALVCVAFTGVALTPEDCFWTAHVQFTLWAFRLFPLVPALMAMATRRDSRFPVHSWIMWAAFAVVVAAYAVLLDWGPRPTTADGLVIQVSAQKVVAIAATITVVYQSFVADRVRHRSGCGV